MSGTSGKAPGAQPEPAKPRVHPIDQARRGSSRSPGLHGATARPASTETELWLARTHLLEIQRSVGNRAATLYVRRLASGQPNPNPLPGRSTTGRSRLHPPLAVQRDGPSQPANASVTTVSEHTAFAWKEGLTLYEQPAQDAKQITQMIFGHRLHLLDDPGPHSGWQKVSVLGQVGYVESTGIHRPPEQLIQADPGLSMIKVKPGQTFWGLVKDVYGIQGNEGTADQNIDHFINAIRAVNKPSAFKKAPTSTIDDIANSTVSGRDASDTLLIANVALWIPSFGYAAGMDVGSGTVTGEISRFVNKIEQKIENFRIAFKASGKYIPEAIGRRGLEVGEGLLKGLADFAVQAAEILAVSTGVGALIGSLFGGVGAIPGAEVGFELGLQILNYYGLYMLVEAILDAAGDLVGQLGQFVSLAWNAGGEDRLEKLDEAGKALAEALGILVSAVLVAAVAYVMKKGTKALLETKFGTTVGQTQLATWLAEREKMTTTKGLGKTGDEGSAGATKRTTNEEEPYAACFLAGTLVVTSTGAAPIETISVGDGVLSRDAEGGEPLVQTVGAAFGGLAKRLRRVVVDGSAVIATPGHRFRVRQVGWARARDLCVGDELETPTGDGVRVQALEEIQFAEATRTFNLTMPATSTYVIRIGCHDVLVHNGPPPPPLPNFDRVLYWVFGNKATVRETDTDGKSMWKTESKADVDKLLEARVNGDGRSLDDPHAFFEEKALLDAGIVLPQTPGTGTAVATTGLSHHSARPQGNPDPNVQLDQAGRDELQKLLDKAGKPTAIKPKALRATCG